MERRADRLSAVANQASIGEPHYSPIDRVLSDTVLAELRAEGAPGCLLCLIDDWEEDWDA